MSFFHLPSDPFGLNKGFGMGMHIARRQARPEYRRPLDDTTSDSMLKTLTNTGLSGLGYVASALDKPGRAVRGVLAGRPDEALAAIPFSDSLGITNPDRAVSGRDLLDKSGLTSRTDKGWLGWGAGVAAETALDPLSYLTFGAHHALTPVGQALAKGGATRGLSRAQMLHGFDTTESAMRAAGSTTAGVNAARRAGENVASQAAEQAAARGGHTITPGSPLGGLIGVGMPFAKPSVVAGTGPLAQRAAGALDTAGDWLQYGNPVGRQIGAWFDPSKQGAIDATSQRAMKQYGTPAHEATSIQERALEGDVLSQMNAMAQQSGLPETDVIDAVKRAREGQPLMVNPRVGQQAADLGTQLQAHHAGQAAAQENLGIPSPRLADEFAAYAPRVAQSANRAGTQMANANRLVPLVAGDNMRRQDLFRHIPGGEALIDRMHALYAGSGNPGLAGQHVMHEMVDNLIAAGRAPDPMALWSLHGKAGELTDFLSKRSADLRGQPYYSPNVAGATALKGQRFANKTRSAEAILGGFADTAVPHDLLADPTLMPLRTALRKIGLKTKYGIPADPLTGTLGEDASGALTQVLERMGIDVPDLQDPKALKALADQYAIPANTFQEMNKSYLKWQDPTDSTPALKGWDSAANLFKNMAYSIWPASHVRNLGSATLNNALTGTRPVDMSLAYRIMRDTATAAEIAAAHPGMPAGLNDAAARDWMRRQAYANAKVFSGHTFTSDLQGPPGAPGATGRLIPPVPGSDRTGATGSFLGDVAGLAREGVMGRRDAAGERVTNPWSVFKQSGVAGQTQDTWSPLAAGRLVGTNIEDYSRLANYLGHVRQGLDPAEAGRMVNKYHFDYSNSTPFEKKFMKRVVPFYTFQSRNLPLQMEQLIHTPGTIANQVRPLGRMQTGYVPGYLNSGVAIPQGQEENGQQRYVSQLGLPVEEAFDRLKMTNGLPDLPRTAMAYMAGLNPLIKGPLEQIFDKQFFSGRNLSDLRPTTVGSLGGLLSDDNSQLFSQFLANTPATRFVTSAEKLADPRKGIIPKALNMLTGVRVSDVDVDKTRAVEGRQALEGILKGQPHLSQYTNFYVRPEDKTNLTPEEVTLMRLFSEVQDRARAAAEARRQSQASTAARVGVRP